MTIIYDHNNNSSSRNSNRRRCMSGNNNEIAIQIQLFQCHLPDNAGIVALLPDWDMTAAWNTRLAGSWVTHSRISNLPQKPNCGDPNPGAPKCAYRLLCTGNWERKAEKRKKIKTKKDHAIKY